MNHHLRAIRWIVSTSTCILLACVTSAASAAASGPQPTQDSSDAAPSMVLLMDSSGSMRDPDASGQPKIEAARTAVNAAIDGLDDSEQVGLRVFGATVQGGVDDPAACTDSQLVVPIGADNRDDLSSAVADFEPKGDTPIGYALQEAAGDLDSEGNRTIVLVSDGLATCDLDPCEVAEDVAGQGIDLTVHVVGFDVDADARQQLRCVAAAGRGVYFDADDADSLTAAMDRLSTRAYRPFSVQGDAVEGTDGASGAPELAFGGQYTDTLGGEGIVKHYAISRTQPGTSVHVGVSALPGLGGQGQIRVGLETVEGEECGWDFAQTSSSGRTTSDVYSLLSAQVTAHPTPDRRSDPCGEETSLLLVVEETEFDGDITNTPYEIVVAEEAPVEDGQSLPDKAEDPVWEDMKIGTAEQVNPGSSFNDAPELQPGQTYGGELLSGETTFFRVPVEFGERLQAQVDFPAPGPALSQQFDDSLVTAKLDLLSPHRGDVGETFVDDTDLNDFEIMSWKDRTVLGVTSADVRWLNRDVLSGARKNASTPGAYYVAVSLSRDEDGDSYLVPFTLTVDTPGQAGDGAPAYTALAQDEETAPSGETDSVDAPDDDGGDEQSEGGADATEEPEQVAVQGAGSGTGSTALWIGLALSGVAAIAAGVFGLTRVLKS